MLMLSVGLHLPLRDPSAGAPRCAAGRCSPRSSPCSPYQQGFSPPRSLAPLTPPIYAVVLASGSAAVLLPSSAGGQSGRQRRARGDRAGHDRRHRDDPLRPDRAAARPHRATPCSAACSSPRGVPCCSLGAAPPAQRPRVGRTRVRHLSKQRHWALDLRLSLLVLFFLAWLAQKSGTSVLIAGLRRRGDGRADRRTQTPLHTGTGRRRRASFIPLYFVVLGTQLDLHGLFGTPRCSCSPRRSRC